MRRIWAAAERIVPRGVIAATTVLAAAVTDPFSMGLYAWAVIACTFFGTLTELPLRQCAVDLICSSQGRKRLRRSTRWASSLGFIFMLIVIWFVSGLAPSERFPTTLLSLAPLVAIPPAQATAVASTAFLQRAGMWGKISLARTVASFASTGIGIPVTFATRSILGAALTVAAAEIFYAALILIEARRFQKTIAPQPDTKQEALDIFGSTYRNMAAFGALSWLQGHSDRWLLGMWAGTSALGTYSLGSAIGRSAGEAIAVSQANVMRVDLSACGTRSDERIREILGRHLRAALLMAALAAVATVVLSDVLLSQILGSQWTSALQLVPVLVLSTFPLTIAASSGPVHVHRGKSHIAFIAPTVCLGFAPAIAFVAVTSLQMAAWVYLIRECVLATIQLLLMGRAIPWREVLLAIALVAVGCCAALAGFGSP